MVRRLSCMLFTDTDSLLYEISAGDVYRDFHSDRDKFDNSDYPVDSEYYFGENKKVIGKMKDETAGTPIIEFVGLKSKMYSYVKDDDRGDKKAKGIKKAVIRKDMKHNDYKDTLLGKKQLMHKMKTIRSVSHQVGSYEVNKISLTCFDDKKYILDDRVSSYAYGHKLINQVFYSGFAFID